MADESTIGRYLRTHPETIEAAMEIEFVDYADNIANRIIEEIGVVDDLARLFEELAAHHRGQLDSTELTATDADHIESLADEFEARAAIIGASSVTTLRPR